MVILILGHIAQPHHQVINWCFYSPEVLRCSVHTCGVAMAKLWHPQCTCVCSAAIYRSSFPCLLSSESDPRIFVAVNVPPVSVGAIGAS